MIRDVRYELRAGGMVAEYTTAEEAVNTALAMPAEALPRIVLLTDAAGVNCVTPYWPRVGETVMTIEAARQQARH